MAPVFAEIAKLKEEEDEDEDDDDEEEEDDDDDEEEEDRGRREDANQVVTFTRLSCFHIFMMLSCC